MKQQITAICLAATVLLTLTACGDSSESVSVSAQEETSVVSQVEESALEDSTAEDSAMEDSAVEEETLTVDDEFAQFVADATGVCLKLRVCDRKGNPVKTGLVVLTAADSREASQAENEVCDADTDSSGYAFLSGLEPDKDYTLTVYDSQEALVGTVTLQVTVGDSYEGENTDEGIQLTVADDSLSNVDLAIIATDDEGEESSFSLFRMAQWKE